MKKKQKSPTTFTLGLILTLIVHSVVGCRVEKGDKKEEALGSGQRIAILDTGEEHLVKECGEVVAGEILTHQFTIVNQTIDIQSINSPADIRVGCGCSSLHPSKDRILAGEKIGITVKVDTAGRSGGLSHGGSITLTSPEGVSRVVFLTLTGTIKPALTMVPASLTFAPEQISRGEEQRVVVTSALPVDWTTLSLTSRSDNVRLVKGSSDGLTAKFAVKYTMAPGAEISEDVVTVQVVASVKSRVLAAKTLTVPLPVVAKGAPQVVVRPGVVPITFCGDDSEGRSRLVVLARTPADLITVQSVTCDGYSVTWQLHSSSGCRSHLLLLTFTERSGSATKLADVVNIDLKGEGIVRLPVKRIHIRAKSD